MINRNILSITILKIESITLFLLVMIPIAYSYLNLILLFHFFILSPHNIFLIYLIQPSVSKQSRSYSSASKIRTSNSSSNTTLSPQSPSIFLIWVISRAIKWRLMFQRFRRLYVRNEWNEILFLTGRAYSTR